MHSLCDLVSLFSRCKCTFKKQDRHVHLHICKKYVALIYLIIFNFYVYIDALIDDIYIMISQPFPPYVQYATSPPRCFDQVPEAAER